MIISKNIFDYCEKNKFNLKQACESDIDEILQLYIDRTLWFKQKQINQWQKYLEHHDKNEFLRAIENNELFIICKNKEIVACFEINKESRLWNETVDDSYYIYKIVTKVGTKNLGKIIFDICERLAKENNIRYLKIDCLTRNIKLNKIYSSYGFDLVKTDTKDYYTFNLRKKDLKK